VLEEQMRKDRTKCLIVGWTRLGLLEITRKKIRESIGSKLNVVCPQCGGTGRIQSTDIQNG